MDMEVVSETLYFLLQIGAADRLSLSDAVGTSELIKSLP
jgi:hypothetical protein